MAMKDAFDVMTDIRGLVNVPAITGLINGGIWPNTRPNNSNKIDLVINCNSISNTATQIGYGNVNIYVPTLSTPNGNGGQQQTPDYAKMKQITSAITPLIDTQFKYSFQVEVEDSGNVFQDTDGSWFANIGFKYYSYNKNYNNI